jgi:hypothetical protein
MGVAPGLDKRARRPVLRGLLALLAGFAAAVVLTLLFGLSLAYSSWSEARGSAFQLVLNVVSLIAVGAAALRLQRIMWRARG